MLLRKRIWDVVVWRHPFFVQILLGMEFIFVPAAQKKNICINFPANRKHYEK